ncbi:MAG: restriction endonuclease [Armatimonadetes bacterium]|nr:restriction endonuclease [Armatimonadota bacterium]
MGIDLFRNLWPLIAVAAVPLVLSLLGLLAGRLWRRWRKLPSLYEIHQMSGVEFERALRQIFERDGWSVSLTPKSRDFGGDLLLRRAGRSVVVQAKRWKKSVGIRAVQEALGARDRYQADEAWVVASSVFSQSAIAQARSSGVTLKDVHWLSGELGRLHRSQVA